MRYGNAFFFKSVDKSSIDKVSTVVTNAQMEESVIVNPDGSSSRKSQHLWIKDVEIIKAFYSIAKEVNKEAGWNFKLDGMGPLQYTEYSSDGLYDWHVDQHSKPSKEGKVRKISFSIFLNEGYEGGEFDIEVGNPNEANRSKTIVAGKTAEMIDDYTMQLPVNSGIFFQSDYFHRVRPVTSGLRKSLVGWVRGPCFK